MGSWLLMAPEPFTCFYICRCKEKVFCSIHSPAEQRQPNREQAQLAKTHKKSPLAGRAVFELQLDFAAAFSYPGVQTKCPASAAAAGWHSPLAQLLSRVQNWAQNQLTSNQSRLPPAAGISQSGSEGNLGSRVSYIERWRLFCWSSDENLDAADTSATAPSRDTNNLSALIFKQVLKNLCWKGQWNKRNKMSNYKQLE